MITSTKNIDYVFHLAAYLGVDDVAKNPIETMEVETIGTQNLINACLKNSVKKNYLYLNKWCLWKKCNTGLS